jgi:hypothetical protein
VKLSMIIYYESTDLPMANRDLMVFGLPCRFPAAPSIRPERRVQDFDNKRLFGAGGAGKKFFP